MEEKEEKLKLRDYLSFVFTILLALTIAIFIKTYVFSFVKVEGISMETSLKDKDVLFVSKLSRIFDSYDRFDVIVFRPFENDIAETAENEAENYFIKRIIGLPGETITINHKGEIEILNEGGSPMILDDKYCLSTMSRGINWNYNDDEDFETITLGPDEYFVLGDNRAVSKDSRSSEVGAINKKSILGRYVFRIWPLGSSK